MGELHKLKFQASTSAQNIHRHCYNIGENPFYNYTSYDHSCFTIYKGIADRIVVEAFCHAQ